MSEVVTTLYDIENGSPKMLNYAIREAKKYCSNVTVVSDWETQFSKRWNHLFTREDLSFIQVERKVTGKNSLDYALFKAEIVLQREGVRRFIILTSDGDFANIAKLLHDKGSVNIIGIGRICCSDKLRSAYDEFLYYPPGAAKKVADDNRIPKGEPVDEVRECLIEAYSLATKEKKWVSIH